MNSDIPESLEDRIAPASLMDAIAPAVSDESVAAHSAGSPAEQPFFGPRSADATHAGSAPAEIGSGSIAEGRTIVDVPAPSISPAFVETFSGAPLGGLDAALALRGLLESDSAGRLGVHEVLSQGAAKVPDVVGLAPSALTTVAGLTSPVLLVDVPEMDRPL